jgi:hypothetical protein
MKESMDKLVKDGKMTAEGNKYTLNGKTVDLAEITKLRADYIKNVSEPLLKIGNEFTTKQQADFETKRDKYTQDMYKSLTGQDAGFFKSEGYKTVETYVNEEFQDGLNQRLTTNPPTAELVDLSNEKATIQMKKVAADGTLKDLKITIENQDMRAARKQVARLLNSDRVQDRIVGEKLEKILDSIEKSNYEKFSDKTKELVDKIKENGGTILKIALVLLFSYEMISLFSQSLTGCMANITNNKDYTQNKCVLKKFTSSSNPIPSSAYCINDTHMGCTDPPVSNDAGDKCVGDYKGSNQLAPPGSDNKICSIFCANKYLVQSDGDLTYSYGCEECNFLCALGVITNSIYRVLGEAPNDVFNWLKKYGIIIVYIVAGLIALGLIGWIVKAANTVYHFVVDPATGYKHDIGPATESSAVAKAFLAGKNAGLELA